MLLLIVGDGLCRHVASPFLLLFLCIAYVYVHLWDVHILLHAPSWW